MRICIDLDGVIARFKKEGETYLDIAPIEGAIEKMRKLKENGHYLIIFTARHMKTCDGDMGKVTAKIGKMTLDWLAKYEVPYDEIYFGKPWAHVYIDDNAFRFKSWEEIGNDCQGLPLNNEELLKG